MVMQQDISLIACIAQNGAIGYQNQLLYYLRQDMLRFKTLTTGHTIIMGKMTYLSLPNGALPNRRNLIVSQTMKQRANEAKATYEVFNSLNEAIERSKVQGENEVFIIGGAMLYRNALPYATRLYLTIVEDIPQQADCFFPLTAEETEKLQEQGWKKVKEETHSEGNLTFRFVDMIKTHR